MASSLKQKDDRNPKPSTTFVQADPSNFRAVVQKLTAAGSTIQQPSTTPKQPLPTTSGRHGRKAEVGNRKLFHNKLLERRKAGKKLEIVLNKVARPAAGHGHGGGDVTSSISPVSTLDVCGTPMEEEEKAIAEKGFYLHPSPIGGSEPELLVLFPLNSPS